MNILDALESAIDDKPIARKVWGGVSHYPYKSLVVVDGQYGNKDIILNHKDRYWEVTNHLPLDWIMATDWIVIDE